MLKELFDNMIHAMNEAYKSAARDNYMYHLHKF